MVLLMKLLLVLASVLSVVGCATGVGQKEPIESSVPERKVFSKEELVVKRAQERWDALLSRNFEKAFGYISPAMRMTLPFEVFQGRLASSSWLSAKVERAQCMEDYCDVHFKLQYYLFPNVPHTSQFEERWIFDGAQWWFAYRG
jgi:hypothetical protein